MKVEIRRQMGTPNNMRFVEEVMREEWERP